MGTGDKTADTNEWKTLERLLSYGGVNSPVLWLSCFVALFFKHVYCDNALHNLCNAMEMSIINNDFILLKSTPPRAIRRESTFHFAVSMWLSAHLRRQHATTPTQRCVLFDVRTTRSVIAVLQVQLLDRACGTHCPLYCNGELEIRSVERGICPIATSAIHELFL